MEEEPGERDHGGDSHKQEDQDSVKGTNPGGSPIGRILVNGIVNASRARGRGRIGHQAPTLDPRAAARAAVVAACDGEAAIGANHKILQYRESLDPETGIRNGA
jgi:hypothetical protein